MKFTTATLSALTLSLLTIPSLAQPFASRSVDCDKLWNAIKDSPTFSKWQSNCQTKPLGAAKRDEPEPVEPTLAEREEVELSERDDDPPIPSPPFKTCDQQYAAIENYDQYVTWQMDCVRHAAGAAKRDAKQQRQRECGDPVYTDADWTWHYNNCPHIVGTAKRDGKWNCSVNPTTPSQQQAYNEWCSQPEGVAGGSTLTQPLAPQKGKKSN